MTGVELCQCFDAKEWAKAFVEMARQDPTLATDENAMHSWFANAIMAGYDHHYFRSKEYKRSVRRAMVPWWKRLFVSLDTFGR